MRITARAYAKVNLYLSVVGKRPDGFHTIETIYQSVDLADELLFEPADELEVVCSLPALGGRENIAYVAAKRLKDAEHAKAGARIEIEKKIPVAAGLAGGSADAAATLLALNRLWGLHLPASRLTQIAASVGSDVPFCLFGGAAFGTGRGTELIETGGLEGCWIVLAKPPGMLLAADVYRAYDGVPVPPEKEPAALRAILDIGETCEICPLIENVLDPTVIRMMPQVQKVKETALDAGAHCSMVSGSGPTVFCVVDSRESAQHIAERLEPLCDFVAITRPVTEGVALSELP